MTALDDLDPGAAVLALAAAVRADWLRLGSIPDGPVRTALLADMIDRTERAQPLAALLGESGRAVRRALRRDATDFRRTLNLWARMDALTRRRVAVKARMDALAAVPTRELRALAKEIADVRRLTVAECLEAGDPMGARRAEYWWIWAEDKVSREMGERRRKPKAPKGRKRASRRSAT